MKAKNMTKRLFAGLLAAAMVFTSAPMTQAEAAKKKAVTITVTTQAELNAALAKKGVTSIVIKTKDNVTLKLTNAASKAKLVVDAPNARISNSAKLAGITIKDAKAFTEKSVKGNSITVADKKLSLTVAQAAQNVTVRSSAKNADINLKVNGELKKLTVDKKADISIKGSTDQTVTIVNNAKGSAVDVKVESAKMALTQPADVKIAEGTNIAKLMVKTDANIEVAKGATVDKVVVAGKDASVAIQADGAVGKVDVNSKAEVALTGSTDQKVELNVNAKDAAVSTAVKTEVKVNADAEVSIEKGAEGSSVAKADGVETKVSNASDDKIVVTDSDGKESSVDAGKTAISNDEGTKEETKEPEKKPETETPAGGSSSDSSSSSSNVSTVVPITAIAISGGDRTIEVGEEVQLKAEFTPANTTQTKVRWIVDKPEIISLDDNGKVVAKSTGTAKVTLVSWENYACVATCNITVEAAQLRSIALSQTSVDMFVGDGVKLIATPVPAAASIGNVIWGSSNTEIATVDAGTVTAGSKTGTAIIACTSGSISATCTVTVKEVPAGGATMVTLTLKNGDETLATKKVVSGAALEELKLVAPTKTGHNFLGWSKEQGGNKITAIDYTSDTITLYAKFEPNKYTFRFPYEDGDIPPMENLPYGESVKLPAGYEVEGQEFLGWSTSPHADKAEVASGGSVTCYGDADYYAVFRRKFVHISGTGSNVKFYKSVYCNENRERYIPGELNEESWYTEENWVAGSFDGYIPYGNTYSDVNQNVYLCFKPVGDYCITGVTVDGNPLADEALADAIWEGVLLSTTEDHTVAITTAEVTLTVGGQAAKVQPSEIDLRECPNVSDVIIATASAIKPSAIFTPSAVNVMFECRVPEIDDKYRVLDMDQELPAGTWGYIVIVGKVGTAEVYSRWIKLQIQHRNETINVSPKGDSGFKVATANNGYVCTASAITLGAIMTFSANTLSEPQFAFAYNNGDSNLSGDELAELDLEKTSLVSGKTYEIRVDAMENDVRAGRRFFKLTVNPPA